MKPHHHILDALNRHLLADLLLSKSRAFKHLLLKDIIDELHDITIQMQEIELSEEMDSYTKDEEMERINNRLQALDKNIDLIRAS